MSKDQGGVAGIGGGNGDGLDDDRGRKVCDEIERAIGRAGGLLRGKEFDVIALSFPRELGSVQGGVADSGYERRSPSLDPLATGEKRASSRERLKEPEEICRASPT